jgi:hypothetical protein
MAVQNFGPSGHPRCITAGGCNWFNARLFLLRRTRLMRTAHFLDNKPFPRRIEPRESVLAMFSPAEFGLPNFELGDAYARTACGRTVYGNSPAGRQFSKMLTEITEGR